MEVLNNIWIAISTPNEGLLNSLSIPLTIIEAILTTYLLICILNISSTRKQKMIFVLIFSFASLISMNIFPNPFNILFNYFIVYMLSYIIFRFSLLKSLLALVISIIVFALVGTLILNPYLTILHIDSNQ